jgi:diguanylate cyclase (GGDEF)-like protein
VQTIALRALRGSTLVRGDELELAELARLGSRCSVALAVPLVAEGETFGAIVVAMSVETPLEIDPELVSSVADLAAASLAGDRRLAESRDEARRDALTGLANRRAFDERLERTIGEAAERGREASVILLDLDDFKQINDTLGHAAGDQVLRQVGFVLLRNVRADEAVFRIGGEEFAIVVEAGREAARFVAERIRTALREQRRGGRLPTVSAGIAAVPVDARERNELVRKADAALYAAKWAGKDRVLAYSAEVEPAKPAPVHARPRRVLLVDDDAGLRALLRTTLEPVDLEVDEAEDAATAAGRIAARRPDVVVLDVRMPGTDGVSFCRRLKADPSTRTIAVVLLTGDDRRETEAAAESAGADAFLRKPFSPLGLLNVVERLAGGRRAASVGAAVDRPAGEQLDLYAQDLRRLLELERGQRILLQKAYREAVTALATALESKDIGTRAHSQRVQRYALELAEAVEPRLLEDPSLEYGFLLHDVGKIGIPDRILLKPAALTESEQRMMRMHTVLGEQMLGDVALLQGEGLRVVRSHHERWDGRGYPDGLGGSEIALGARIFAVADTLDAITSDRPYRRAGDWRAAVAEIERSAGAQFDPDVVGAFLEREPALHAIHTQLAAA